MQKTYQTIKLDWTEIGSMVGKMVSDVLGRSVCCCARSDAYDFWTVSAVSGRFNLQELRQLLDFADADSETRCATIPVDSDSSASLDMSLSELLLQRCLDRAWQEEHISEDGLWLIGVSPEDKAPDEKKGETIQIESLSVELDSLWPKDEFVERLFRAGGAIGDLSELCDRYVKQYGNELYWAYPITDGIYNGVYFVLVREGILCLPYNEIDSSRFELFEREGVRLVTAAEMVYFRAYWIHMSDDLLAVMNSFVSYLIKQEGEGGVTCG